MALETWLPEELKFEGKKYLFIVGPINIDKTRKRRPQMERFAGFFLSFFFLLLFFFFFSFLGQLASSLRFPLKDLLTGYCFKYIIALYIVLEYLQRQIVLC